MLFSVVNRDEGRYVPFRFTAIPHEVIREHMGDLTGAELKCLLYIVDRTFGFNKVSDRISLRQFSEGITKKDGARLDRGTGLSRSGVKKALRGLIAKGLVRRKRNRSRHGDRDSSTYGLKDVGVLVRVRQSSDPPGAPAGPTQGTEGSQQDKPTQDKAHKRHMAAASPPSFFHLVSGIDQDSPDRLIRVAVRHLVSRLRDIGINGADGLVAHYLRLWTLQDLAKLIDNTLADAEARDPVALLAYRLRHGFPPP